jgi:hypothetical protein
LRLWSFKNIVLKGCNLTVVAPVIPGYSKDAKQVFIITWRLVAATVDSKLFFFQVRQADGRFFKNSRPGRESVLPSFLL